MLLRDVLPLLLWCLCPLQTSGKSSPSSPGYSHTSVSTYNTRVLHCCQSWCLHPAAVADDSVSQNGLEVSLGTLSCQCGRTSVHLRQMNFISGPSVPTATTGTSWLTRGGGQKYRRSRDCKGVYITHHGTCSTVTREATGNWMLSAMNALEATTEGHSFALFLFNQRRTSSKHSQLIAKNNTLVGTLSIFEDMGCSYIITMMHPPGTDMWKLPCGSCQYGNWNLQ